MDRASAALSEGLDPTEPRTFFGTGKLRTALGRGNYERVARELGCEGIVRAGVCSRLGSSSSSSPSPLLSLSFAFSWVSKCVPRKALEGPALVKMVSGCT